VAFDDSVPTYLPVYMRSRWLDMNQLQAQAAQGGYAGLDQHVLFSSGWEWGYWQNDYATLRMNFGLPAQWDQPLKDMFAPWGQPGQQLAAQLRALGDLQSQALIDGRLAPYLASRDKVMDIASNVISQPKRTSLEEVAKLDAATQTRFSQSVLVPLAALESSTVRIQSGVTALKLDPQDPWLGEAIDGVDIDVARTQFIRALYEGVAAFARAGNDAGWLAKADTAFTAAQAIVKRRHGRLHYPNAPALLEDLGNATLYQYGYLKEADSLCYWQRERIQARAIVLGELAPDPGCVL
jgi:hypothetical protein